MTVPAFLAAHLERTPSVSTIAAGLPFLDTVVRPLIGAYKDDPLGLADLTLFLPNQRAKRRVAALFSDLDGEGAAILPRLRTLGDIDEEDLILSGQPPAAALDLDPPAELTARRLILARLLRGKAAAQGHSADWPTALSASDTLGRFLDGLHRDEVPFSLLKTFTFEDLEEKAAKHWQESLAFLNILGEAWPEVMAANGWMEPAARRTALLSALGETIADSPDGPPVIVAGPLGTVRATARFMARIANSPRGHVILPGLDTELDEEGWARIEDPHPQAVFRDWLRDHLGDLPRRSIPAWTEETGGGAARRQFLSLALRPADATDSWYEGFSALHADGTLAKACDDLSLLTAETADEEAALISLLLREALEVPDQTAMLVTPDRDLARRVCAKLRAWSIIVDDAGGTPLTGTFRGTFLRACAACLDDPASSVALLQILNHDLSTWGQPVDVVRQISRRMDYVLRGPKFPDWERLCRDVRLRLEDSYPQIGVLLERLSNDRATFMAARTVSQQIGSLVSLAEWLASTPDADGAARLWRYEDGEELAQRIEGLLASPYLPEETPAEGFGALFDALLGSGVMRRRGVGHPRLFVYGLVEARLQTADLTILAGLNEGIWPDGADEDAFLSRGMRSSLGLGSPEQAIGRAANDFEQHASRPRVVLSRAERHGRSPSNPSRWWVRIESFLRAGGFLDQVDVTPRLRALRQLRERPDEVREIAAPLPNPPRDVRPHRYRVTDIGKLIRDPYAIYGRLILNFKPWRLRDAEIGYLERGTAFHAFYQQAAEKLLEDPSFDVRRHAEEILSAIFDDSRIPDEQMILWQRGISRAVDSYLAYEETVRSEGQPALIEAETSWLLDIAGEPVELVGRPDRIDRRNDGGLSIVDYKSASAPTMKQEATFDPQLSLLALMARHGAFAELEQSDVYRIAYLPMLSGSLYFPVFGDLKPSGRDAAGAMSGEDLKEHLAEAERRFHELLTEVMSGNRPFPSQVYPMRVGDEGDFDHLARRGEWGVRGGDAGEGGDGD